MELEGSTPRSLGASSAILVKYTIVTADTIKNIVVALSNAAATLAVNLNQASGGMYISTASSPADVSAFSPTSGPTPKPTPGPTPGPTNIQPFSASSCFAGSESVTLESGESIAISSVTVGDRVLAADTSGKALFAEVVYIPHGGNSERTQFVNLITENKNLKMTKNHILPGGVCGSTLSLVYASEVSIGDCIQTVSGQEVVTAIEIVPGKLTVLFVTDT
jgi:hypothetical protein